MIELATWRQLYEAALSELDEEKFGQRIAIARNAIKQRMRDLLPTTDARNDEQQQLADALQTLDVLQREARADVRACDSRTV
jgi:hypothetical protein